MSKETVTPTMADSASTPAKEPSYIQGVVDRLRRGDVGQLPVIFTLIIIGIYFQVSSPYFLTAGNLSNLVLQIATIGTISLGAVLVLLLGEIDLSLAALSNTCGAFMVTLSVYHNFSAPAALAAGLVVGLIAGALNGFFVAYIGVPSFIVTLASSLFYSGLVLHILLPQTTIRLSDPTLTGLATSYVHFPLDFIIAGLAVVIFAGAQFLTERSRQANHLKAAVPIEFWARIAIVAILAIGAVFLFESALGIPYSTLILLGLITFFWLLLKFTPFGRFVYATGGNAEAARRAGINVRVIRLAIFSLAGGLAAMGGILESARSISASAQVDPTLLLNAIAAAVIGGVSLFGGRGSPWNIILGVLVIGALANGLALLGKTSDIQFMVEGAVLLIAVTADALLRRRSVTGVR